jgi:hypothetical protein
MGLFDFLFDSILSGGKSLPSEFKSPVYYAENYAAVSRRNLEEDLRKILKLVSELPSNKTETRNFINEYSNKLKLKEVDKGRRFLRATDFTELDLKEYGDSKIWLAMINNINQKIKKEKNVEDNNLKKSLEYSLVQFVNNWIELMSKHLFNIGKPKQAEVYVSYQVNPINDFSKFGRISKQNRHRIIGNANSKDDDNENNIIIKNNNITKKSDKKDKKKNDNRERNNENKNDNNERNNENKNDNRERNNENKNDNNERDNENKNDNNERNNENKNDNRERNNENKNDNRERNNENKNDNNERDNEDKKNDNNERDNEKSVEPSENQQQNQQQDEKVSIDPFFENKDDIPSLKLPQTNNIDVQNYNNVDISNNIDENIDENVQNNMNQFAQPDVNTVNEQYIRYNNIGVGKRKSKKAKKMKK